MRKPQFGLVTGLLIIFFVLVLVRSCLERYIPQLPPNKLANLPGAFLQCAVHEPVDWQPNPEDAFNHAATLKRPLLFVLGTDRSKVGRLMDNRVFSNWSVASEMNDAFVPVRIDLEEHPDWKSAVFPISRMMTPFLDDFQMFAMDSNGKLQRLFVPPQSLSQIDAPAFQDELVQTRKEYDELSNHSQFSPAEVVQRMDELEIASPPKDEVTFDQFAQILGLDIAKSSGAFTQDSYLQRLPEAWLYLSRVNHRLILQSSLDRFLLTPAVDVIRGGFFDIQESRESLNVDFDKDVVGNAAMAAMLAECGSTCQKSFYTAIGERTFDMLLRDLDHGGLFDTTWPSDDDVDSDRSPSSSLYDFKLGHWVAPSLVNWANQNLDLGQNHQLIPYFANPNVLNSPDYDRLCRFIRQSQPPRNFGPQVHYLSVTGSALASLCRCARIWNDLDRLNRLREIMPGLKKYVAGDLIYHSPQPAAASTALCDYLAFSDAKLQYYLATGQTQSFEEGKVVLIQAMYMFFDRKQDCIRNSIASSAALPDEFKNPQLEDGDAESTCAQAIRLCMDYGRMLGPSKEGRFLIGLAGDQFKKFVGCSAASPKMAGFFVAAAQVADPICAFVVGPNAVADANRLFRIRPSRLVSAADRDVRPDLRRKKPGVYLCNGSQVAGPISVDEAANRLPAFYEVGVPPDQS